jgi:hypothetical protein
VGPCGDRLRGVDRASPLFGIRRGGRTPGHLGKACATAQQRLRQSAGLVRRVVGASPRPRVRHTERVCWRVGSCSGARAAHIAHAAFGVVTRSRAIAARGADADAGAAPAWQRLHHGEWHWADGHRARAGGCPIRQGAGRGANSFCSICRWLSRGGRCPRGVFPGDVFPRDVLPRNVFSHGLASGFRSNGFRCNGFRCKGISGVGSPGAGRVARSRGGNGGSNSSGCSSIGRNDGVPGDHIPSRPIPSGGVSSHGVGGQGRVRCCSAARRAGAQRHAGCGPGARRPAASPGVTGPERVGRDVGVGRVARRGFVASARHRQ